MGFDNGEIHRVDNFEENHMIIKNGATGYAVTDNLSS